MAPRTRLIHCHHCHRVLVADERLHYGYECHACVVVEHELVLLARRDPDHPDLARLGTGPVETGSTRKIDLRRAVA